MKQLVRLFLGLEEAQLRYAVLRNYEKLPADWGNDIDILIHPEDLPKAISILHAAFSDETPERKFRKLTRWNFTSVVFESFRRPLQLDFYTDITKAWFIYADRDAVLGQTQLTGQGIRIPRVDHELQLIAAKELFSYGRLREKYRGYFQEKRCALATAEGNIFKGRLTRRSVRMIQRVLDSPTNKGWLCPTVSTFFAVKRFMQWSRSRSGKFVTSYRD